ncbi:MAG: cytochrome c oxidase subunit II [Alphaproteobacteria bacterium]|nr:cytochrome c oxidase subunit II [Alphaproteobacteria bacterium]
MAVTMLFVSFALVSVDAFAAAQNWQIGFQDAASPLMAQLNGFHNYLLVIITAISVFVMVLLAVTCYRFREKKNPVPSKTTHNTLIEVIWTVVPIFILIAIAIPSFRILFFAERLPKAEMTLKVIGYQWYWSYKYPDYGNLSFDSNIVDEKDLKPGQPRLLTVDNPVVLPVDTNIRLQTTAADVIHCWAIPAFAIKMDAIPGKLNETWFKITKPGTYYGQCSELCGIKHGFMPIVVNAVSKEEFAKWIEQSKKKFAAAPASSKAIAQLPSSGTITQ